MKLFLFQAIFLILLRRGLREENENAIVLKLFNILELKYINFVKWVISFLDISSTLVPTPNFQLFFFNLYEQN